ncbi:hypothetical protein C8R45DRAFT_1131118 [Mycena sanguinolenta]|nr:hypothetical protein C8R45DRAFT_1131118 [Mycena sanguinolenta]
MYSDSGNGRLSGQFEEDMRGSGGERARVNVEALGGRSRRTMWMARGVHVADGCDTGIAECRLICSVELQSIFLGSQEEEVFHLQKTSSVFQPQLCLAKPLHVSTLPNTPPVWIICAVAKIIIYFTQEEQEAMVERVAITATVAVEVVGRRYGAECAQQEGPGEWLLNENSFKKWESSAAGVLWCSGILGVGKTVLAYPLRVTRIGASGSRIGVGVAPART